MYSGPMGNTFLVLSHGLLDFLCVSTSDIDNLKVGTSATYFRMANGTLIRQDSRAIVERYHLL